MNTDSREASNATTAVTISSVHSIRGIAGESKAVSVALEYHDPIVASLCSCDVSRRPRARGRVGGKEKTEDIYVDSWISNLTNADTLDGGW